MIDVHCHILPNVDDGSDSIEKTRLLLSEAINNGISDVCITPHFSRLDNYMYYKHDLLERFNLLKSQCTDLKINLYLGNELMIDAKLDDLLAENKLCSLNDSKYVLIEFPLDSYSKEYDEYLYNISLSYKIIIAHPERYAYVQNDVNFVDRWLKHHFYLQINQNSLFNFNTKRIVHKLIDKKAVHLIASDCHNEHRPLQLKQAYEYINKKYSNELAELLLKRNPYNVINDLDIEKISYVKKHFFKT